MLFHPYPNPNPTLSLTPPWQERYFLSIETDAFVVRQANTDLHLSKTLTLTPILFQPIPNPNPNPTQPYPLLLPAKEVTFSPLRHLLLFYDLAIFPAGTTLNPFVSRTWRVSRRANLRCFYRTFLAQSLNKPLLLLTRFESVAETI